MSALASRASAVSECQLSSPAVMHAAASQTASRMGPSAFTVVAPHEQR